MSICKIGETKVINGKRYRKERTTLSACCEDCSFISENGCELFAIGMKLPSKSIEEGGRECAGSIWFLADDQPEAPTATPPRDEVREQRRFTAAVAAMQGLCANRDFNLESASLVSRWAVEQADSLLAELDRTGAGK